MITAILATIWVCLIAIPLYQSIENNNDSYWKSWLLLALVFIIPTITGINVKDSEGQYKGYITSIEQNGAIFKGWNVYLKSDLTSSNEDIACIDRDDEKLIERLKIAQERKENVLLDYESVWQFKIGECPNSDWKITGIKQLERELTNKDNK